MNSLVPSSYLVSQSNKTVDLRSMSLVSALLNRVTPTGATQAVTQAVRQGSRWALNHGQGGGTVKEVPQGGAVEGAASEQTGRRKKGDEPAHQPVRHSLGEQSSLEAYNEFSFGCLDEEVEAL